MNQFSHKIVASLMAIQVISKKDYKFFHPHLLEYLNREKQYDMYQKLLEEFESVGTINSYIENYPNDFHSFIDTFVFKKNNQLVYDECSKQPYNINGLDPHEYILKVSEKMFDLDYD